MLFDMKVRNSCVFLLLCMFNLIRGVNVLFMYILFIERLCGWLDLIYNVILNNNNNNNGSNVYM